MNNYVCAIFYIPVYVAMSKTTTTAHVAYEDAIKFAEHVQVETAQKCTTVIGKYQQALETSRNQTKMVAAELTREKNAHNETKIQLERATAGANDTTENADEDVESVLRESVDALNAARAEHQAKIRAASAAGVLTYFKPDADEPSMSEHISIILELIDDARKSQKMIIMLYDEYQRVESENSELKSRLVSVTDILSYVGSEYEFLAQKYAVVCAAYCKSVKNRDNPEGGN